MREIYICSYLNLLHSVVGTVVIVIVIVSIGLPYWRECKVIAKWTAAVKHGESHVMMRHNLQYVTISDLITIMCHSFILAWEGLFNCSSKVNSGCSVNPAHHNNIPTITTDTIPQYSLTTIPPTYILSPVSSYPLTLANKPDYRPT